MSKIRRLLKERGIFDLQRLIVDSIRLAKSRFSMILLQFIAIFEPILKHRKSFRCHSVIAPLPIADPVPLEGTVIVPAKDGFRGQCVNENVHVNPVPPAVAVIDPLEAKLMT